MRIEDLKKSFLSMGGEERLGLVQAIRKDRAISKYVPKKTKLAKPKSAKMKPTDVDQMQKTIDSMTQEEKTELLESIR